MSTKRDYWRPRGTYIYQTENEGLVSLLCGHLHTMTERLRLLPEDKWDWTPAPATPTARILAAHTWQWLISDRMHILEPDALKHEAVPEPPTDPAAMCDLLAEENDRWFDLLLSLTPEQLARPAFQFNAGEKSVRGYVCQTVQNTIYKHGQFATLFFTLGLDGTEPYSAPFPNPMYQDLRDRASKDIQQ